MIYLDHAATSYPKPPEVVLAMQEALTAPIGNAGRSGHDAAMYSAEAVYRLRVTLSDHFLLGAPERVVLTKNATEALNLAILGVVPVEGKPWRVVTSVWEHNSVLRPLFELERLGRIELHFLPLDHEAAARYLKDGADLCCFTCVTNTTGERLPVERWASIAHEKGALVLVDASQAAGHRFLSMKTLGADYLCVPAHKGMLGLTGLGALLVASGAPLPKPLLFGGAGYASRERGMPEELPERLEAGTLPIHASFSWEAGIRFLNSRGVDHIAQKEESLARDAREEIVRMGHLVYGSFGSGIVLFNVGDHFSEDVARRLAECGVCVRGGLHCAPLAHAALGTEKQGAVRVSFGYSNTERDVEGLLSALFDLR